MTTTTLVRPNARGAVGESAMVGIFDRSNRVLLARTTARPHVWQPLGGHTEPTDMDPLETVIREVREESNLAIDRDSLWPVASYPSDTHEGKLHFFFAQISSSANMVRQEEEIEEMCWFSITEARKLPALNATRMFLQAIA